MRRVVARTLVVGLIAGVGIVGGVGLAQAEDPPTGLIVTPVTPSNGATYYVGQEVPANYSCTSDVEVITCDGDVADGANIDTATPGNKTFTIHATDALERAVDAVTHYTVVAPQTECRARSAVLFRKKAFTVANGPLTPCLAIRKALLNENVAFPGLPPIPPLPVPLPTGALPTLSGGLIHLGAEEVATTASANGVSASADVADATIVLPGLTIQALGLFSDAGSQLEHGCSEPATIRGVSRIAQLQINNKRMHVDATPSHIRLGALGTLYINYRKVTGNEIIRRTLFLDFPNGNGADIAVAESQAGISCNNDLPIPTPPPTDGTPPPTGGLPGISILPELPISLP